MNVLVITMDDMRYDEMAYMPNVRRLLAGRGTTFSDCQCNVPLCSPTRAGMMTGQLSRHHGVVTNAQNLTDAGGLNQYANSTFKAIDNAGYRVGMVGKFFTALAGAGVKAGFDFWRALDGSNGDTGLIYDAFGYTIYDGTTTIEPTEYQDFYLAGQAIDFMRGAEPWCLWYCPTGPHWPWTNPPNHTTEWNYRDWPFDTEATVTDKPAWVQALPALTDAILAEMQIEQRVRLRELLVADDAIGAMVNMIDGTGLGDDTTIYFTSDNGMMLGEHRIVAGVDARATYKNMPYAPSMHVPMVARGPAFAHETVTVPVMHQDMVKSMHAVAGSTALAANQAGVALQTIAASPGSYMSRELLGYRDTAGSGDGFPSADIITTATRKLVRYIGQTGTNQYELYDRTNDPDELVNRANDGGAWLTERTSLASALDALLA